MINIGTKKNQCFDSWPEPLTAEENVARCVSVDLLFVVFTASSFFVLWTSAVPWKTTLRRVCAFPTAPRIAAPGFERSTPPEMDLLSDTT
jgi:hypothetical protein